MATAMPPEATTESVRALDRTRWLGTLFVPETVRPALLALAAYRLELIRIVDGSREPMAAEIRLQWWRDAIRNEGYGEGASVPLVDALRDGIARYGWPVDTVCAVSEAFIHDLYADPFEDWDAFDGDAGEAYGAPVQLAAIALGIDALGREEGMAAARTAATAAGYAGVAMAAADTATTFAPRFARGRTRIPAAAWREATGGDLTAALSSGASPEASAEAVRMIVAHGREADVEMREHLARVASSVRAAFLPALVASLALDAAHRSPIAPRAPAPWRVQLAMWREARRLRA